MERTKRGLGTQMGLRGPGDRLPLQSARASDAGSGRWVTGLASPVPLPAFLFSVHVTLGVSWLLT